MVVGGGGVGGGGREREKEERGTKERTDVTNKQQNNSVHSLLWRFYSIKRQNYQLCAYNYFCVHIITNVVF